MICGWQAPSIDIRRRLVSACSFWYPVVLNVHRFFVPVARAAVDEDGHAAKALHPTVWSEGGLPKRRRLLFRPGSMLGFLVLMVSGVMGL